MRPAVVIPWLTAGGLALGLAEAGMRVLDVMDDRDAVDASKMAFLDEWAKCRVELIEERGR